MRRSVQGDAAADDVRVATEPLLPENSRDERYIRALFFFRSKIPAEDRSDAKDIEIVGGHSSAENLDGVAHARKREGSSILSSEPVKERLSCAVMLKSWRGKRDIDQIARLIASEHVDDA